MLREGYSLAKDRGQAFPGRLGRLAVGELPQIVEELR